MTAPVWGLLEREQTRLRRRTRGLGLGSAVRTFHELAVPGLGSVWFARPLFLAALGIRLARKTGLQNIEVGNAIEALACWHARGDRDPRVLGRRKLAHLSGQFVDYKTARRRGFYVTTPMRQGTLIPLRALGLVEDGPQRFNAYTLTETGERLVDLVCADLRPNNSSVDAVLERWIRGDNGVHTQIMRQALDPRLPLPDAARELLRERLERSGEGARRRATALSWIREASTTTWEKCPAALDAEHWADLRSGAGFFGMQQAAVAVLDEVESVVRMLGRLPLKDAGDAVGSALAMLAERARGFLGEQHDPSPGHEAQAFAHGVTAPPNEALRSLTLRDGRGLELRGDVVVPGPVFPREGPLPGEERADDEETDEVELPAVTRKVLPDGISSRMYALHTLDLDLSGRLDAWLGQTAEEA